MPATIGINLERVLQFVIRGERKTGVLRIRDIVWLEERKQWACHWSISFINPEVARRYGEDPLDALSRTVDFLSSLIRGSEADGLVVWWREQGDHGGLTFPSCESQNWKQMPPLGGGSGE